MTDSPAQRRASAKTGSTPMAKSPAAPEPLEDEVAEDDAADDFAAEAAEQPELAEIDEAAAQVEIDLDLAATAAERDEYLDALRRLQADFENYKKRMLRQQTETLERAGEDLILKLLPVLDASDLARQHGATDDVALIANALADVLTKEGLERLDPVGQPFDPNEHEAVAHEPGETSDGPEVVGLMRAGYRWKGRLVRAALVTVRG